MDKELVHLHLHTEYSMLDGMNKIKALAKRAKELSFKAMAITDHGNMFGVAEFSKQMIKAGIKPIVGCEMYIIPSGIKDKTRDNRHIVLLAKNEIGYHNLCMIASIASIDGHYYEARIDHEILKKYSEGLIVLSACLGGDVSKEIQRHLRFGPDETPKDLDSWASGYEAGLDRALWYKAIFGEDYYLEIQDNGIKEQYLLNEQLIKMSLETGIKLVWTNDSHYLKKEQAADHDVFMALGSGTTVADTKRKIYGSDQFFLKSYDDINYLAIPKESVENTIEIANKCTFQIEFGTYKIPKFTDVPEGMDSFEYLEILGMRGLKERYPDTWEEHLVRFEYELRVVRSMGFNDYFLIVWDFVDYARRKKYFYGPGRGSGAGSILAYCLYITHLDPIKYKLIFERFLNPDRVSAADFDWDIDDVNRQDMIRYVENKYGKECVGQIITFQREGARKAPRDAARALGFSIELGDKIAKAIPAILNITIEEALETSVELRAMYDTDINARRIIDVAMSFEGLPSNPSTHAAGVVIAPFPLAGKLPLWKNRKKGTVDGQKADTAIVVQSEMGVLEEQGYLKMDFLGLNVLTIIGNTIRKVKQNHGIEIDYEWLLNGGGECAETYAVIAEGDTEGLFQLESHGMTQTAKAMNVSSMEELTALISLYRPGPMEFIPDYIANKKNPAGIHVPFVELEEILKDTYGVLAYQEQVMEMVKAIANYTMAEADDVRKAIGKKKEDLIAKHREIFAEKGSVKYPLKMLYEYYDRVIVPFGRYAFNKSHGASYARVAEMTAYLKAFYPVEFMSEVIQSAFSKGKTPEDREAIMFRYFSYLKKRGIELIPPDIQAGTVNFEPTKDGKIIYGLSCIKDVGEGAIVEILNNKFEFGPYEDFSDFVNRSGNLTGVTRATMEGLISAGATDSFGINRSEALVGMEYIMDRLKARKTTKSEKTREAKFPFLTMKVVPHLNEIPRLALLQRERIYCSAFITGHPLDSFHRVMNTTNTMPIGEIIDGEPADFRARAGRTYKGIVIIESLKEVYTKRDRKAMAICAIADFTGSVGMPIFEKLYTQVKPLLTVGDVVYVEGRLSEREDIPNFLPDIIQPFGLKDIKSKVLIAITRADTENVKRLLIKCGRGDYPVTLVLDGLAFPLPIRYWIDKDSIAGIEAHYKISLIN